MWSVLYANRAISLRRIATCPPLAMLIFEKQDLQLPFLFRADVTRKEIRSLEQKRSFLLTRNSSPHDVLPIRRVQHQLPDIVTPGSGFPERFFHADAAQRTA